MRNRLPAGSRNGQSRMPYGCSLGSWTTFGAAGPATDPDRVLAYKAYSSRATRAYLRTRGIGSVIPEPDDQKAHRKRIGSSGGRPVTDDRTAYRGRNVIERAFNGQEPNSQELTKSSSSS